MGHDQIRTRTVEEPTGREEEGIGTDSRSQKEQVGETTTGNRGITEEENNTGDKPKSVAGTHQRLETGTAPEEGTGLKREDTPGPGRGAGKEAATEETGARDPTPGPPRSPP